MYGGCKVEYGILRQDRSFELAEVTPGLEAGVLDEQDRPSR